MFTISPLGIINAVCSISTSKPLYLLKKGISITEPLKHNYLFGNELIEKVLQKIKQYDQNGNFFFKFKTKLISFFVICGNCLGMLLLFSGGGNFCAKNNHRN